MKYRGNEYDEHAGVLLYISSFFIGVGIAVMVYLIVTW